MNKKSNALNVCYINLFILLSTKTTHSFGFHHLTISAQLVVLVLWAMRGAGLTIFNGYLVRWIL